MATEADLIQKFKDLDIPVGADFEELIHAAFASSNLADQINSKADDSKVVHTADMRKPASDVAGIDEVSTLQTQVDNSAVGTNLIILSGLKAGYLDPNTGNARGSATDFYSDNYIATNGATVFTFSSPDYTFKGARHHSLAMYDSNKKYLGYQSITSPTQTLSKSNVAYIRFSINSIDESGTTGNLSDWLANNRYKLEKGSVATDWCPNPEDKVNVADMRKPASDVAGIEEVNAKQDKIGYTPADDSKVAHLSGANNFDTTPTVNNNPLLLASSLPADLARTSQQTNFTNGLQSGGVNVATAADLKSLADKAWYMKSLPDVPALKNISLLYQVDNTNKKMNIVLNGSYSSGTAADSTGLLIADFSDIIQGITGISIKSNTNRGGFYCYDQSMQQSPIVANNVNLVFSGTKLYMNTGSSAHPILQISGADYLCLMYGSTISYTELV